MKHPLYAALAALLLLSFAPSFQNSVTAQECATTEGVSAQLRREWPDVELRVVDGLLAARLRAGIAGLIRQNVPEGGSYLIAHPPATLTDYVVRFAEGCATHHGRFPDRLVRAWLDGSPA
jgi:hypothetical protein